MQEIKQKGLTDSMSFLADTAIQFVGQQYDGSIYEFIAQQIHTLAGDATVTVSEYDTARKKVIVRAKAGENTRIAAAEKVLGRELVGSSFDFLDAYRERMSVRGLSKLTKGVYELSFEQIPRPVAFMVEKVLGVGDIYSAPFRLNGDLLGFVAILLERGSRLGNGELIEAFMRQAAIALQRQRSDDALQRAEQQYRNIFENNGSALLVTEENGVISLINGEAEGLLGSTKKEVEGRTWESIVIPEDKEKLMKILSSSGTPAAKTGERPELTLIRGSGETRCALVTASVIPGTQKTITSLVDITSRKHFEETLKGINEKLRKAIDGTIIALAKVIEIRDPYTAGHEQHTSKLAVAIVRELGLSEECLNAVRMASLIHDVGKIYVPAEILNKPGKLSDVEFEMVKIHPTAGYDILKAIEFPWPIAEIVRQHQERFDGSGYPRGLSGNDILLEARIVSVADVVEAMTFHRPYKPSAGIEKALEEISKNRGILYDPRVADACLRLFREKAFHFE